MPRLGAGWERPSPLPSPRHRFRKHVSPPRQRPVGRAWRRLDYVALCQLNLGYDFIARCTSAVAPMGPAGCPALLRNMDWGSLTEARLRRLTATFLFQRGGRTVFSVSGWVGFVSAFTGPCPALPPYPKGHRSPLH